MKRTLGTCYYPEHWPRDIWEQDAARMVEAGLTWVRIGEFAWSRLEPSYGNFQFEWLDDAISVLGSAGLKVVLGTPTATPPRWMIDRHPDMLAVDENGNPRKFGSRRHYCFSHEGFRAECARIVKKIAARYGKNPHVAAWQTDNEYGCHDTAISYSDAARVGFQNYCRAEFTGAGNDGDIKALNAAWGNVFWSMDYDRFEHIDLPNLTVTEANPAHRLAFMKYTSDQVVTFNRLQVDIIKRHSDAPIAHNYMGRITDFDHFKVGDDLEIASWDSYPLGFLEDRVGATPEQKQQFMRQGDPDFQAFHHDLYRRVGKGRWWVMEQQPGPVNWAPYNPAPLPGMVALWSWEAFAHGAEAVCYFRWRQAPFAQEQMHAGLLRPDSVKSAGMAEAIQVAAEITNAPDVSPMQAPIALLFDYEAEWAWAIQPHGAGLSYFGLVFETYRALRSLGLSIDILAARDCDLSGYKMVLAPGLMDLPDGLKRQLADCAAPVILGPRSGARNEHMSTPVPMPPAVQGLDLIVTHVESLPPNQPISLPLGGHITGYREFVETSADVLEQTTLGEPVLVAQGNLHYLAAWLDQAALTRILETSGKAAGIKTVKLPNGVRRRETGAEVFWFNYDNAEHSVEGRTLKPISTLREIK